MIKITTSIGTVSVAPVWRPFPLLFNVEGGGCLGFLKRANVAGPTSSNMLSSRICQPRLNIDIWGGKGAALHHRRS